MKSVKEIQEGLTRINEQIVQTVAAVESDRGASPVLNAVVKEFGKKSKKALDAFRDANDQTMRDHVIELEQAADSAKAAAEADTSIKDKTRQAVLDAHMSICILKTEV